MSIEKIDSIQGVSGKSAIRPPGETAGLEDNLIEASRSREGGNQDHFEALMNQGKKDAVSAVATVEEHSKISLMDHVRDMNSQSSGMRKDPKELLADTEKLVADIGDIKEKLKTPQLELDPNTQYRMRNSLTHIDDSINIALKQTGSEFAVNKQPSSAGNTAIEKFLGLLADGQHRLENLGTTINGFNKEEISPAQMILLQMKVNKIQQELEFFSNALNKALEGIKTLGNVQV